MKTAFCAAAVLLAQQADAFAPSNNRAAHMTTTKMAKSNEEGPLMGRGGRKPPPRQQQQKLVQSNDIGDAGGWSGLDLSDGQLGAFGRSKDNQGPRSGINAAPVPSNDGYQAPPEEPINKEAARALASWSGLDLNNSQLGTFGRTKETQPKRPVYAAPPPDDDEEEPQTGDPPADGPLVVVGDGQASGPGSDLPGWGGLQLNDGQLGAFGRTREEAHAAMRGGNSQPGNRPPNSQPGRGSFAAPDDGMRSGGRAPPNRQQARAPPAAESHKIDIGNLMDGSKLNNPQAGSFSQNRPKPRNNAGTAQQPNNAPPRQRVAAKPVAEWKGLDLTDGQLGAFGRTKETQPTWSVNGPPDGMPPPEENLVPPSSDEAAQALASWSGLDLNDGQLSGFGRTKQTQPKRPVYAAPPKPQERAAPAQSQQGMPVQSQQGMPVQSQQGMPVQSQQGMPVQRQQGVPVQSQQGQPVQSQQSVAQESAATEMGNQAKVLMDGLLQTPKAQNVGAPNIAPPPSDPAAVRLEAEARVSELLKSQKIGLTQQTNLAQQGFATQGEVDAIRLEAKQETQLLQKDFEAREKSLVQEIGQLSQRVAKEEENVAANHQMKNRILETRIQLDKELATLRKEYDADKKKWETAVLDQEKLHNHQLHSSQRDFNKLQDQLNAMQHEYALAKSNSAFTNPTKLAEAEKAANVIFQQRADATLIAEKEKLQAGMMKAQEARAKIETELTALRRKYEYDSYDWKQTMAREIKERDKLVEGKAEEFKKLDAERVKAAEVLDTRDEELAQFKADSVTLHALLTTFQEERINMEGELNLLKAKYEADHQLWQQQMADAGLARAAQEAEIANLSAEITKMLQERAEAVEKPSSMSVLADKLSSRNKNVAKQKELVKSLRAEVAELKEGNANSAGNVDTIQAMSLELETREQELAMQREEIDNLRSGMAEMNNDRADKEGLVASLNKMTAVLATRDKELAKQDLEMVELRATVAKMKKEGPDVQDQLASIKPLKEELAARDKAFFKQKAELKKLQATLTQIHEERAEVDGQLASINAMAAELEARDKDEIKQKVQMEKLQSEITKLKQKRADADGDATKLRTMTRNLAARDKELTKQKAEVDRLRGQMTNLEKERKSERSKSASSRMGTVNENGEKAKMQIELTKMKVERAKLDSELATLKKEHEQERLRWEEQNSGGRDDAEKLAEQKAKLEKLRAEMANVKEERSDMGSFFDRAVGSFFGSND